jgi:K+-transporting ATPase ATPase C chain
MSAHIRANLLLLVATLVLCCVLYPLVLWGIGQTVFHNKAEGSLIDKDGKPTDDPAKAVGSRLIGQPFTGDEYFQPRPSATTPAYNAAASGASNLAASNYMLRFRVAKALGPIVRYGAGSARKGQLVGPDIEAWFQNHPLKDDNGIVAQWAQAYPSAAKTWVQDEKANAAYVEQWQKTHSDEVTQWIKDNPGTPEPKPEDLAGVFFASYARTFPGTFPSQVKHQTADGKTEKVMEPVKKGTAIQAYFFDMWRQENPNTDLEQVSADMVMASGSGLDPHITLENALYQARHRVAAAQADKLIKAKGIQADDNKRKEIEDQVYESLDALLKEKASAPLGGLVGAPPLVNVLEVNLAVNDRVQRLADAVK